MLCLWCLWVHSYPPYRILCLWYLCIHANPFHKKPMVLSICYEAAHCIGSLKLLQPVTLNQNIKPSPIYRSLSFIYKIFLIMHFWKKNNKKKNRLKIILMHSERNIYFCYGSNTRQILTRNACKHTRQVHT